MAFPNTETQFRPGQSGNPGGKAKGSSLTSRLRAALAKPNDDGSDDADKVIKTLVSMAIEDRDFKALAYVFDRLDGKTPIVIQEESKAGVIVNTIRREAVESSTEPLAIEGPTDPSP